MIKDSEELNLFFTGNKNDSLINCINEIKEEYKLNLKIKIINDKHYQKEDYYNLYYDNINDGSYFNAFIINYTTKHEVFEFFKDFNNNYNKTYIKFDGYPFFLIDENIYNKKELIKDIKMLNENKPIEYHLQSKDILAYSNENSFKNKLLHIYNYYTENELLLDQSEEEKTLNILLCGIKGVGKTFFMNKLLFENRGLSKENNHTTKLNKYRHKLYPISFFDIPGFGENEDIEMTNTKSYIKEFNNQYEKIKNKIHIILYIFNCDSARLLQDKEVELIENFFTYNIPIYFIGNKSNDNEEKTFKRSILFKLKKMQSNHTYEYLESHIFCINNSNKSIYLLLNKISEELEESKNAHLNIINIYENNNYLSDSIKCYYSGEEEENNNNLVVHNQNIHQETILREMKKSIFFNDISYSISKIQDKVSEITENIKKESKAYMIPFKSIEKDLKELTKQIEKEYQKLIDEKDIKEIEKVIKKYVDEKMLKDNKLSGSLDTLSTSSLVIFIPLLALNILNPIFSLIPTIGLLTIIGNGIFKKNENKKKIEEFSKKINKKFLKKMTLYDSISNKINAEKFNLIIDKFNQYIKHFNTENENDIDLIENKNVVNMLHI